MQIRCQQCHKPYALKKEAVHQALDMMTAEKLTHYDTQCPHCRRVNHVSRSELLHAAPNWGKKEEPPSS